MSSQDPFAFDQGNVRCGACGVTVPKHEARCQVTVHQQANMMGAALGTDMFNDERLERGYLCEPCHWRIRRRKQRALLIIKMVAFGVIGAFVLFILWHASRK